MLNCSFDRLYDIWSLIPKSCEKYILLSVFLILNFDINFTKYKVLFSLCVPAHIDVIEILFKQISIALL